jgi:hypothetical protein
MKDNSVQQFSQNFKKCNAIKVNKSNLKEMVRFLSHLFRDADLDVVEMMTQLFLGQTTRGFNLEENSLD